MTDPWIAGANCLGRSDIDWDGDVVTAQAADVCGRCRVRTACVLAALEHDPKCDVGIWGGTNVYDRRRIRDGRLHVVNLWQAAGYPYRDGELFEFSWEEL